MKGKLTKAMMVAMMLVTVFGLAASLVTVTATTATVAAATDKWSRMDLPTTLNYQMFPDSIIWDLTAADDGTLFALVEDTTGDDDGCMEGGAFNPAANATVAGWNWDGLRWAVYPAYSDIAVFKSTTGGCSWTLCWHVPSSETGAPIAVVPQPGYTNTDSSKDTVFVAMGSRYISGNNGSTYTANKIAGNLSEGNIYRSLDGCGSFTRVTPRCPAVVLAPHGPNTGGTITSIDVVTCPVCSTGCQDPNMVIVGVSSLGTSTGGTTGGCGEGVWTWNANGVAIWNDIQVSNSMVAPPTPGTMPAGNGLDVVQVYGSRNYGTDGCIIAVANDILDADPAGEPKGIYVCFYDGNDGIWGGDIDSPTTACKTTGTPSWLGDYAWAAAMDTGTDFNNVTAAYVFVGLDGCATSANNDLWRVRGLATVTGPSTVSSCGVYPLLISSAANPVTGGRISDVMIPAEAGTAVYVGCEFPQGQAQELLVSNALVWATPVPSFKPTAGAWPTLITNAAGTIFAAGGGDCGDVSGKGYTKSGVSKQYTTSRGPVYNGVGLIDDIAVSEDIPGFTSTMNWAVLAEDTWCLAEALAEEVSPTYATDGLIYVSTWSEWSRDLSLWRLTSGCWERIMVEDLELPNGKRFDGKNISTKVGQFLFANYEGTAGNYSPGETWWPRVVPQFSTDQSMFLLGGINDWTSGFTNRSEMIWYSPDKGNDWKNVPQMPIGAAGYKYPAPAGTGLTESGWWVQDSNTLFMGDDNGWIYKTTNRGASWTDGVLTGMGLEITSIRTSPIYSETGAAGTDKYVLVGTYDQIGFESEVWLSEDGCSVKDLENVGDALYVSPSWRIGKEQYELNTYHVDLGGTVVNFDNNWATNGIVYAASQGWMDKWDEIDKDANSVSLTTYTDVSVVRTVVDKVDPSAATWEHLWDRADWNAAAPAPQPPTSKDYWEDMGIKEMRSVLRLVIPSAIEIGQDGTVYVAYALGDSSYNTPPDNPTPNAWQLFGFGGRVTFAGVLRCLDGTAKTTEWETCREGLGPWDGLWLMKVVPGNNHIISLTFDWKEWRFKLAFWEDTLSGAGPAAVAPVSGAQGVGALVADTSVNVPLSWQAKGGATQYEWQVSEDSAFTASNTKSGTTSDLSVTVLDLKPATTYYWRTRALEPMLGKWSTPQTFTTVIGGDTGAPGLITPEIGATITDETPLFTWEGIASATNYQIQVATSPSFGAADIVIDEELGDVQAYEADKELVNGTYYWQVKGSNADTDTETPWSALGSFTLDTEAGGQGTPVWVWILIVLGVLLVIIVMVLILRTRRPV